LRSFLDLCTSTRGSWLDSGISQRADPARRRRADLPVVVGNWSHLPFPYEVVYGLRHRVTGPRWEVRSVKVTGIKIASGCWQWDSNCSK
jgi:hypothetical protein